MSIKNDIFSSKLFKIFASFIIVSIFAVGFNLPVFSQSLDGGISIVTNSQSDPSNPQTKAWFIETLKPGEKVSREAKVSNNSKTTQSVKLFAKDSTQTSDGAFTFRENDDANKEVGTWLKLEKDQITLESGKSETVKFEITVPAGTAPGEYAGVVASQVVSDPNAQGIAIQNRVGARVYITVPGELKTGVKISNLELVGPESKVYSQLANSPAPADEMFLAFTIQNTGNIFEKTFLNLKVTTPAGEISKTLDQDLAPRQGEFTVITDLGNKWQEGDYSLTLLVQNRPIITTNKGEITDNTEEKSISSSIKMTSEILEKMAKDKSQGPLAQAASSSAQNSGFLIQNADSGSSSTTSSSSQSSSNTNNNALIVGGVGLVVVLILGGVAGYLWMKLRKANTKDLNIAKDKVDNLPEKKITTIADLLDQKKVEIQEEVVVNKDANTEHSKVETMPDATPKVELKSVPEVGSTHVSEVVNKPEIELPIEPKVTSKDEVKTKSVDVSDEDYF